MMFLHYRSLVLGGLLQWIMPSNGIIVCNDTDSWNNGWNCACNDYQINEWCANDYFRVNSYWTGGSYYRYPEFNCCSCGKGWPLWFVPEAGYEASKAVPALISNGGNSSVTDLQCIDPIGNADICNMTCQTWLYSIISLGNITNNDFGSFNCTLMLQTPTASMSYALHIPQDNYLVYFTNWTTTDFNLSCSGNIPPPNSSLLCRHGVVRCPLSTTTRQCVSSDCVGTLNWTNANDVNGTTMGCSCSAYEVNFRWCTGGTFTPGNRWTLGSVYKYPEFNCCGCGKGWPLWLISLSGSAAIKASPQLTNYSRNSNITNLQCIDVYGKSAACNMTCKPWTNPLTSITTITANDFGLFNCTLSLQTMNASMSYVIQIPQDNYLVYFTNWTTSDYNLSCVGNTPLPNSSMLCRHDFIQCLSTTVTTRYIPLDCVDTSGWTNGVNNTPAQKGWSCFEYEVIYLWCAGGTFTPGNQWTLGAQFNYPELNCCACGKASNTPYKLLNTVTNNASSIPSDFDVIDLYNCNERPKATNVIFSLKCLGPSNFTKLNTTANIILYNCPLNCFFDRNLTAIDTTQSVNVTYQQVGTAITHSLVSDLFPNFKIICQSNVNTGTTTLQSTSSGFDGLTMSSLSATNAQDITDTSMTTSTTDGNSSLSTGVSTEVVQTVSPLTVGSSSLAATNHVPETVTTASLASASVTVTAHSHSPIWSPPVCANGNIGLNCNITVDPCQMADPCLNNGSCVNVSSSSYTCTCTQGFTGLYCETDIRPCKPWTCLNHGQCNETSNTTFRCDCHPGYEGLHCESRINRCRQVTCQNNGQCRPSLLNFSCECTTSDFTGRYCEVKSTSLVIKAAVKRSVGYIAIIAIVSVICLIVVLDILKYVLNIDPVEKHRKHLAKQRQNQRKSKSKAKSVVRFEYVNAPLDESSSAT